MKTTIRKMSLRDYERVFQLWSESDGIGLAEGDSREGILSFLRRNPGLSFVAEAGNAIVGAILSSHDGRRGFIYHLAVAPGIRRTGIGRTLTQSCLDRLQSLGIPKCHIVVFARNRSGQQFWRQIGWTERSDSTDDVEGMRLAMPKQLHGEPAASKFIPPRRTSVNFRLNPSEKSLRLCVSAKGVAYKTIKS